MGPKIKESEKCIQKMEIKYKVLDNVKDQASTTLEVGNTRKVNRLKNQVEERLNELYNLISKVTELKIAEGDEATEVTVWTKEEENKMQLYEDILNDLVDYIKDEHKKEEEETRMKEERIEEGKRQRMFAEHEQRLEMQKRFELELEDRKLKRHQEKQQKAKLPKLQISKFDGTITDWVRFWEQFDEEIDKAENYAEITKFSYLRELLTSQPKAEIAGLPFNDDGYEKAKQLLQRKYGQTSEIIHAHGQRIANLPNITSINNLKLIHQFYRNLNISINSLKTLGKLETAEILVRQTLDKLGPVKTDIIRMDPDWQSWNFERLLEELRGYTNRNPEDSNNKQDLRERHDNRHQQHQDYRVRGLHTRNRNERKINCVYCNGENHRSSECNKIVNIKDRKDILKTKRLCYNCTGLNHSLSNCRSRNCAKCNQRHHTSICHLQKETSQQIQPTLQQMQSTSQQIQQKPQTQTSLYMLEENQETIHPTLVAIAKGQKFRVLLDTGAGNSFVSSTFINHLNIKPLYWETKELETMVTTMTQKLPVYDVEIHSTDRKYSMNIKVNKLDRPVLTTLRNPRITQLKKNYPYLTGLQFDNEDDKVDHPIHIILGAGDIARIKAGGFIAGKEHEPVAEKTLFGWTLMGQGKNNSNLIYFANTSQEDYKTLYNLDVLGLEDRKEVDQMEIYQDFKEQLQRKEDGTYSTHLPWKEHHQFLPENKLNSIARLNNQLRKLKKTPEVLEEYHNIMTKQLEEGILEEAPKKPTGKRIFYMPHRAVIRTNAETTKTRIVYDASARENQNAPSLNDCLHVGPALQPMLQDVLIRQRLKPIALLGDVKQAFLQIWIDEEDRDALRLHWIKDLLTNELVTLRFTKLPFGCGPSPFILNATLAELLETFKRREGISKTIIEEIQRNLFVDDLTSGGQTEEDTRQVKQTAIKIFASAGFTLHKWHSNLSSLEQSSGQNMEELSLTYAKEHVGTTTKETKILGVAWNKEQDVLSVNFSPCKEQAETTKRGILRAMASVYDPLGVVSPILLVSKQIFREICESKLSWDKPLTPEIEKKWLTWKINLPDSITIPRSILSTNQQIREIELHGFGDASKEGCCSAIYVVAHHTEGTVAKLLTAKSRIAKRDTSIPRLELVAGHMVANSLENVRKALSNYPNLTTYGWLDSTVALHWISNKNKEWKQFVSNRVEKIRHKKNITWRHCPTTDNPADIGSRGSKNLSKLWFDGPSWLTNEEEWPENIVEPSKVELEKEQKPRKEIQLTANLTEDSLSSLLEKHKLVSVYRITAWVRRFINNYNRKDNISGELSTKELKAAEKFWIQKVQQKHSMTDRWKSIEERLQLKENEDGIIVCRGRIQGEHPIYLPDDHQLTRLIIQDAHKSTNHGLVSLTMGKVRQQFWIERLRKIVKSVIHQCNWCRKYHKKALVHSGTISLPSYRIQCTRVFETTGVDFAGPFEYKNIKGEYGKAYLTLFTCATSRAVYLDLLKNMEIDSFRRCLKEFFTRRGNPNLMVSDNAKTFQSIAKWLKEVQQNAIINTLLSKLNVEWKFNLSRSPWWGGFFERLVGMSKQVIYKSLGKSRLTFEALREVVLEAEVIMNNRPLGYLEDDVELPPLTPNMMIHGTNIASPEEYINEDPDFSKQHPHKLHQHLQRCKDKLWKRWKTEYLLALRERHQCSNTKEITLKIGDIVQIKGEQKNRGEWHIGVITKIIVVENVIVGAKIKLGNNTVLERPVQLLYPMELRTDVKVVNEESKTNNDGKIKVNDNRENIRSQNEREAKQKACEKIQKTIKELSKDEFDDF